MELLGGLHEQTMTLLCERKHQFTINYAKKLSNISCLACKRDEKDELKEKQRAEEEERNEQNRIQQEKLFAQAQEYMEREKATNNNWWSNNNSNTSYTNANPSYSWPQSNDKKYLRAQEQERCINSKSSELARSYLA